MIAFVIFYTFSRSGLVIGFSLLLGCGSVQTQIAFYKFELTYSVSDSEETSLLQTMGCCLSSGSLFWQQYTCILKFNLKLKVLVPEKVLPSFKVIHFIPSHLGISF